MKKISLIVIAVSVVSFFTLMSAGEEMSQEQKQQMEQVDQMVKEKVEAFKVEKDLECKTRAMEVARAKADSLIAMSLATTTKKVTTTTVKKSVKPVKKAETVGQGKPKLGGNQPAGTVGSGKPKLGDQDKNKDGKKDSETTVGKGKPKLGN